MENVYEQFFFLKYSGGWSFAEAYSLPIGLRNWFTQRLIQQIETENDAVQRASGGRGSSSQTLGKHNQPALPPNMGGTQKTG